MYVYAHVFPCQSLISKRNPAFDKLCSRKCQLYYYGKIERIFLPTLYWAPQFFWSHLRRWTSRRVLRRSRWWGSHSRTWGEPWPPLNRPLTASTQPWVLIVVQSTCTSQSLQSPRFNARHRSSNLWSLVWCSSSTGRIVYRVLSLFLSCIRVRVYRIRGLDRPGQKLSYVRIYLLLVPSQLLSGRLCVV